jgi:hypothetical protein
MPKSRFGQIFLEELVLTDRHSVGSRDDREWIDGARQAAEDLFKPKRDVAPAAAVTPTPNPPASAEQQQALRRPRILPIALAPSMSGVNAEPKPEGKSAIAEQRLPRLLPSQFGRVRTLTRYGMTPAQVAELYGVLIDEVEQIIGRSVSRGEL